MMSKPKNFLEQYFKEEKNKVDLELEKYLIEISKSESIQNTLLYDFIKRVKDYLLPPNNKPKRLHPIILIASFLGIANPHYIEEMADDIISVALSVELLHNAKLIHDDLIDKDITRRGFPSFHIRWANQLLETYTDKDFPNKEESAREFGATMAILGGNITYFLGSQIIFKSKFENELKFKALAEYNEAFNSINKGLIIEEYMFWNKITMTLEQYLNIAELKTASLFEKSTKIGAILAKGNLNYQINPLSDFMLKLGQVHSIRDDILDLEKDLIHGEKKFPYIIAIQNTTEDQQKIINELYGKPDLNKNEIEEVVKIINETNALKIAQQFGLNLISQAKESLKKIYPGLNKKSDQFFKELLNFSLNRTY